MQEILLDLTKPLTDMQLTSDVYIKGIFKGKGNENIDNKFRLIHNGKGIHSRIHFKVVLNQQDQFKIEPIIEVAKGSKGTDTYLKVEVLLLGDNCRAEVIPSLEIKENEVKAGHGATISKINKDHLYYLLSRGLSAKQAEIVLIKAFLEEPQDE
jgi:Fe-S cluster assembly protein SufD